MSEVAKTEVKKAPAKSNKPREEVHSKDAFVEQFQAALKEHLHIEVSKAKAWDIYKVGMNSSFQLAAKKPLSLSGIGRFSILSSKRSEKANKPALRMRFRASSRVNEVLNEGKSFLEAPAPAPAATADTPAGEGKAKAPAAAEL